MKNQFLQLNALNWTEPQVLLRTVRLLRVSLRLHSGESQLELKEEGPNTRRRSAARPQVRNRSALRQSAGSHGVHRQNDPKQPELSAVMPPNRNRASSVGANDLPETSPPNSVGSGSESGCWTRPPEAVLREVKLQRSVLPSCSGPGVQLRSEVNRLT